MKCQSIVETRQTSILRSIVAHSFADVVSVCSLFNTFRPEYRSLAQEVYHHFTPFLRLLMPALVEVAEVMPSVSSSCSLFRAITSAVSV